MMDTSALGQLPQFTVEVPGQSPRPVTSVYCADLLSWAISRAPEGCAWCTVMGNVNAVAVAAMADAAAIVLCEDAQLDADARARAEEQDVVIVRTALPCFAAGVAIAQAGGLMGL